MTQLSNRLLCFGTLHPEATEVSLLSSQPQANQPQAAGLFQNHRVLAQGCTSDQGGTGVHQHHFKMTWVLQGSHLVSYSASVCVCV